MSLKSTKTPDDSNLSPDVTKLPGFTGSTTTFLRGDGSFATPSTSGAAGVTTTGTIVTTSLTKFSGTNSITSGNLSGDISTSDTLITVLATTGVAAGTYGSSTESAVVSVNAKGLVTTITTATISTSGGGSGITELTGDGTAGPGSGSQALTLATTGAAAGTYGSSTESAIVSVNAKGLVTTITTATISTSGGGGSVGNLLDYQFRLKATQSTITTNVLTIDTTFDVTVGATQFWVFDITMFVTGGSTIDFKYGFTAPAGAVGWVSGIRYILGVTTGGGGEVQLAAISTIDTTSGFKQAGLTATTAPVMMICRAVVKTAATTGTVSFYYSQDNASTTFPTTIHSNSFCEARRLQ